MVFSNISEIDEMLQLYDADIAPEMPIEEVDKQVTELDSISEDSEPPADSIDDVAGEPEPDDMPSGNLGYEGHTEVFREFHKSYMLEAKTTEPAVEYYADEKSKENWSWGDELITYKEKKEYVRTTMMNALMHGNHNQVDPASKDRFEFWKYASKFNQLLSFMLYDTLGGF